MSPAVVAEQISYHRGGATLLDHVDLRIEPGAFLGVVGPNGAGKTTLLKVLAGDLVPTGGTAQIADHETARTTLQDLAQLRAYLGPEGVSEIPFSVREVVAMGRHPHRRTMIDLDEHEAIVDSAMERTDIAHLAARTMGSLSTGEQQRVGLARVIAQDTPVLLLDEPTSALDIGHQEKVMRTLRSLANDGAAIIAILHDLNLAAAHTDQIMLLDRGRKVGSGRPSEVLTSDSLSTVYRQPMEVIAHPHRDCPLVLTVDSSDHSL